MASSNLRSKIIRLAHEQPELRKHLLPLLVESKRVAYQAVDWTTRIFTIVKYDDFALKGENNFTFSGSADIRLEIEGRYKEMETVQFKAEASRPNWRDSIKISTQNILYRNLILEAIKLGDREDIEWELSKLGVN